MDRTVRTAEELHNVLIVDDNAVSRKLTRRQLDCIQDLRLRIYEVDNGADVAGIMNKHDIDIIIMDLVMPERDGLAVLEELKSHEGYRNIPVIVQSSLDDCANITRALKLGAYDYFVKPAGLESLGFIEQTLQLKVRNAINSYSLYKQAAAELAERTRVERILRMSEERHQAIMDQTYDGIGLFDLGTRRIVQANARFAQMMGYDETGLQNMTVYDIFDEDASTVDWYLDTVLLAQKFLPATVRRCLRKDGTIIYVERTASLVRWSDGNDELYYLIIMRDVTDAQKRQDEIRRDLIIAERVQQGFLPPEAQNDAFQIKTYYKPRRMVSGDLFDYSWDGERRRLTGYLMDVSGHGTATALIGAALKSLFRQTEDSDEPLSHRLRWLNAAVMPYCHDEFFVAAFYFQIDFNAQNLIYSSGGINHFVLCGGGSPRLEEVPGSLLGVFEKAVFTERVLPLDGIDFLLFFSDGLMDALPRPFSLGGGGEYHGTMRWLDGILTPAEWRDDISLIGVNVKK